MVAVKRNAATRLFPLLTRVSRLLVADVAAFRSSYYVSVFSSFFFPYSLSSFHFIFFMQEYRNTATSATSSPQSLAIEGFFRVAAEKNAATLLLPTATSFNVSFVEGSGA